MGDVTSWWWVRHAPVTANHGCCYGQTDFPCDVDNDAAFRDLARQLPRDAVWVASPLKRTHMTGQALVAAGAAGPDPIPGPGIDIEPDLIEQNFGAWQGVKYDEIYAKHGDSQHRLWLAPAYEVPPGGESFAALTRRVHRAIERLNQRYRGRDIVSMGHGGTIRAALALALDIAPEHALTFVIDNLSLNRIDHFPGDGGNQSWRVAVVNQPPR
jgi:alpha-ribazole phosphatase